MAPKCAAVILAGGRSERMGRAKSWLPLDGTPALRYVTDVAAQICPTVVVAASPGQTLPDLAPGIERIDDPADRTFEGPLSGIASALEVLAARQVDLAYIGACDSVFLDTHHIAHMLRELNRDRQHPAVVPESGPFDDGTRFLHATCGAVRVPVAWQTAAALLMSGKRAARSLYEGLNARRLAVASLPEPRVVRSCNTPEEWHAAVAELTSQSAVP
ncbi:MAG: molybdenum cofactor guanylyltransferase [Myxococcota bacterium]